VVDGLGFGQGLTAIGDNLYWPGEPGEYSVASVATSGGTPKPITSVTSDLGLRPFVGSLGYLYWRSSTKILRTLLAGGPITVVASGKSSEPLYSITNTTAQLVASGGYVYFPSFTKLPSDTSVTRTLLLQRIKADAEAPTIPEVFAQISRQTSDPSSNQQLAVNQRSAFVLELGYPPTIYRCTHD
jgi:hypothetical protein